MSYLQIGESKRLHKLPLALTATKFCSLDLNLELCDSAIHALNQDAIWDLTLNSAQAALPGLRS